MLDKEIIKKILNTLLKTGADFSEIFSQKKKINSIRLEDNKIESANSGLELGCGMRIWKGNSTIYGYVDSLEKEKLFEAAKTLSSVLEYKTQIKVVDLNERDAKHNRYNKRVPSEITSTAKGNILRNIDAKCRDYDKRIIQVSAGLSDSHDEVLIANSEGDESYEVSDKVFLSVSAIARKNKEIRTGYKSFAKTSDYGIFKKIDPLEVSLESATMAIKMLDAVNAPVGLMPVIIGPAFGGVIFHEACGHGLEADAILKNASVFKDKIGKKIASNIVTAIDDPTIETHWGSYKYDSETYPSSRTVLIEDGVLQNYISDLRTSKKLKIKQTGNGRRQSFREIPIPRMSNTFIERGKSKKEDLVSSVEKGLFAKEFAGGQVDPATGDFVFGISEGYLIEKGRITSPVKGATLIGNGPEVLNNIIGIADDLDFAPGFCGKDGQSIANEVGQPTILVSELTVGGVG
jgi:TldD protein